MEIKIKVAEGAEAPSYATSGSAGMDLVAVSKKIVQEKDHAYIEYGTGISMEIPEGFEGQVRPRSSIRKTGMFMCNSPGTIDSDYRGEITVSFRWIKGGKTYEIGDRVAQLLITPTTRVKQFELVNALTETDRGEGGHGSTGK